MRNTYKGNASFCETAVLEKIRGGNFMADEWEDWEGDDEFEDSDAGESDKGDDDYNVSDVDEE
jgi:hypothetical protein